MSVPGKRFLANCRIHNHIIHNVFSILTLTFIQCHTEFNQENNHNTYEQNSSIISETVQAIPIAVTIVRRKIYICDPASRNESPVPKDAERHWDVNLILFKMSHMDNLCDFEIH